MLKTIAAFAGALDSSSESHESESDPSFLSSFESLVVRKAAGLADSICESSLVLLSEYGSRVNCRSGSSTGDGDDFGLAKEDFDLSLESLSESRVKLRTGCDIDDADTVGRTGENLDSLSESLSESESRVNRRPGCGFGESDTVGTFGEAFDSSSESLSESRVERRSGCGFGVADTVGRTEKAFDSSSELLSESESRVCSGGEACTTSDSVFRGCVTTDGDSSTGCVALDLSSELLS